MFHEVVLTWAEFLLIHLVGATWRGKVVMVFVEELVIFALVRKRWPNFHLNWERKTSEGVV